MEVRNKMLEMQEETTLTLTLTLTLALSLTLTLTLTLTQVLSPGKLTEELRQSPHVCY